MRFGRDGAIFQADTKQAAPHPLPPKIPIWAVYLIPHYRRKYTASSCPASAAQSSLRKDQSCTRFLPRYSVTRMQTGGEAGRAQQSGDYGKWGGGVGAGGTRLPERCWVARSGAWQEDRALGRRSGVTHLTLVPGCLPAPSTATPPSRALPTHHPLGSQSLLHFLSVRTPLRLSLAPR